ncbi:uncharacterized protein BCR38DRAFT_329090 [Pseudomassariella vexata]|uniref:Nicotinamide N-methyltransferase n=1 Tax=Pseudomassariella vexata TaxID=1141098 RepID=A0A1Y2EKE6_9PEZI|nr:uncharacterized protein BCR38DRAFT_329090 [Pseudomassariella vexata]ORY71764.1 hypothetical protein BCR38DRAFT_329090 [Pseudomassariella vexata]
MASRLTSRISVVGPPLEDPEDFLGDSLGVVFPDEIMNLHGDAQHALHYTSPHLPEPLHIQLSDPDEEDDRRLFSHYLWNASLLLAELVEAGTLGLEIDSPTDGDGKEVGQFNVTGLTTLEVGAGTALPSMLGALLGAKRVVVSDYPTPLVMEMLRRNMAKNMKPELSPRNTVSPVLVDGHSWGELDTPFAAEHKAAFDRIFVCDCLWMPTQHANLQKSIAWFMKDDAEARAWVVAGFHTGRAVMRGFFKEEGLKAAGLEIERIWERDCNNVEREWIEDRGPEDDGIRKRWLVVGVLRRARK